MKRSVVARISVACIVLCACMAGAWGETSRRTYANPVDVDYRYNFEQINEQISYRTGADPVIVRHQDAYYLFMTLADGYWRSSDLLDWKFIQPSRWPFTSVVAPAAISDGDRLLLMPSTTRPEPILVSRDPAHGKLDFLTRRMPEFPVPVSELDEGRWHAGDPQPVTVPPGPWDPALFKDDDGRWYLYWGSSNKYPLYGIELDLREADTQQRVRYVGKPRALIQLEPARHGWERFGRDHMAEDQPVYVEGAWMTKVRGRYYLQYGAPGTEFNVYATGTYVSDKPLGPFEYVDYNPVGYKPGGFVQGAGHGNTFQDVHGNYWSTGTPWIGVNWNFERRIGMHPAGFDADGQMFVDTRFGDFPHWLPTKKWRSSDDLFTGWMLLSYRKPATASSAADSFPAQRVTDDNPRTFWVAARNRPGEWVTIDLGRPYEIRAVQVNYADYKSGLYGTDSTVVTRFRLSVSSDGRSWRSVADLSRERRDRPNAYVELAQPARARYVRYDHVHVGAAHLAISDIRVFGNGSGARPATPTALTARRDTDERNAMISWEPVSGVVGYNVRWGIAPNKLYQTYQRFNDQGSTLELRALNVGQAYWVAIESFDENGVSALSAPIPIR